MTETNRSQRDIDMMTYESWKLIQQDAFSDAYGAYWFAERAELQAQARRVKMPRDPFVGPYWAMRPYLTGEAIAWFESDNRPRYTFTDWQAMERDRRQAEADAEAEAEARSAYPLQTLAYAAELHARRGALIAEARANGTPWGEICEASRLSRAQANALIPADYEGRGSIAQRRMLRAANAAAGAQTTYTGMVRLQSGEFGTQWATAPVAVAPVNTVAPFVPGDDLVVEFAVLLSSASRDVYEDLVCTPRFKTRAEAANFAATIERAQPGVYSWIMRRDSPAHDWSEFDSGRTARQVLNDDRNPIAQVLA